MARTTSTPTVEQRLNALEQRMSVVESERPGRKPRPLLAVRQRGVCALDPDRDSSTCPDASIYRYQSGCHGDACRLKQHNAYERRKNGKAKTAEAVKVTPPKKRVPRQTTAPKAPPSRRAASSKAASSRPVSKKVSKRPAA